MNYLEKLLVWVERNPDVKLYIRAISESIDHDGFIVFGIEPVSKPEEIKEGIELHLGLDKSTVIDQSDWIVSRLDYIVEDLRARLTRANARG